MSGITKKHREILEREAKREVRKVFATLWLEAIRLADIRVAVVTAGLDCWSSIDNGLTVSIAESRGWVVQHLEAAKVLAQGSRTGSQTPRLKAELRWMEGIVPYLRDLDDLTVKLAGKWRVLS